MGGKSERGCLKTALYETDWIGNLDIHSNSGELTAAVTEASTQVAPLPVSFIILSTNEVLYWVEYSLAYLETRPGAF